MRIDLIPVLSARTLALSRSGETLTINGDTIDFSVVPEGAIVPMGAIACDMISGTVRRIDGQLRIPVILPIGYAASAAQLTPAPIIDPADGPIALPE